MKEERHKPLQVACTEYKEFYKYRSWGTQIERKLREIGIALNEGNGEKLVNLSTIKTKIEEIGYKQMLEYIRGKKSLQFFTRLNHYKDGAHYINNLELDERRKVAKFRLGTWSYNSKRDTEGNKLCAICNEGESEEHLMFYCEGVREITYKLNGKSVNEVMDIREKKDQTEIAKTIGKILKIRNDRLS